MNSLARTAYRPRHLKDNRLEPFQDWAVSTGSDYVGRHAMTPDTHVRFVELPDGDVRKIRVFAS